jgi:hypothetical protein
MKLVTAQQVKIQADDVVLPGELAMPDAPRGIVLFAHGSSSSRHSQRNRLVASILHDAALRRNRLNSWQGSAILDWVTLGRAPARPLPCVPPRRRRRVGASKPWCPGAGVLTWQDMTHSAASRRRC